MARRLCRLPRLLPHAAAAPQRRLPILAANPSPAARLPRSSPTPPPSFPTFPRLFSTSSSAGDSGMVVVGSADSFDAIHTKVQDEKLPAIFYYTAVWCGPCRMMAPVIDKLSKQYPKIPVYKVDIDLDGIGNKLGALKICSVPTFHLYHKGEKTSEVVGADVNKLQAAMESLHKQQ